MFIVTIAETLSEDFKIKWSEEIKGESLEEVLSKLTLVVFNITKKLEEQRHREDALLTGADYDDDIPF